MRRLFSIAVYFYVGITQYAYRNNVFQLLQSINQLINLLFQFRHKKEITVYIMSRTGRREKGRGNKTSSVMTCSQDKKFIVNKNYDEHGCHTCVLK